MKEEMLNSAPLTVICNRLNLKGTRGAETSAKVNGPILRDTQICMSRRRRLLSLSDLQRFAAPLNGSTPEIEHPSLPPLHHLVPVARDVLCFALVGCLLPSDPLLPDRKLSFSFFLLFPSSVIFAPTVSERHVFCFFVFFLTRKIAV